MLTCVQTRRHAQRLMHYVACACPEAMRGAPERVDYLVRAALDVLASAPSSLAVRWDDGHVLFIASL